MDTIMLLIGQYGVILLIGLMFFFFAAKKSQVLFTWIENQTYGTRDYVLEKLEFLFIEIAPHKVVYMILGVIIGPSVLAFGLLSISGSFKAGIFMAIVLAFICWKSIKPFMDYLVARRIKLYESQMVDAMNLLSNGVRAGLSLPQALGLVVDELRPPVSQEFNMILQQNKIGVPLEECFEELNKRVPTQDNQMFVTSINILRESGGNLAEVFDTIVDVIRERIRLQQKIDTFTSQGMFQGMTIFSMPFVMALIYHLSDPEALKPLYTTTIGFIVIIAAIVLDLIGGFFILKIVKIKV